MRACVRLLELFAAELQGHRHLGRYPVRRLRLEGGASGAAPGCVVVSAQHTPDHPLLQLSCTAAGLTVAVDPAEQELFARLHRRDPPGVVHLSPHRIRIADAGGLKRLIGVLLEHRLHGEIYPSPPRS
jgi:hypothetical protein